VRRPFIWIVAFGVVLALSAVLPRFAGAQSGDIPPSQSALAVSPAIIEEVLTPGKATEFILQVNNVTNYPLPIKAMVRDFAVQSEELEKAERSRLDASKWFTLQEPDFILQPKQVRTVKGSITPPADAVPGGRYATIYFQPLVPQEVLGPSTAYLSARVGVLAFLIVKGDIEQKAAFQKGLYAPGLAQHGPIPFDFSLSNTGSVHLMPKGKLTIRDWRGRKVKTMDLPTGIVLPGAARKYQLEWAAPGAFGKYTAELEVSYGSENAVLGKKTVTFWVVPWGSLLTGVIVLTLVGLFVRRTRRRWRKAWRALHRNY
jgi:hypothetical protein